MIYRVDFDDGTFCHTGYRPLADVWAKRKGAKMTGIDEMATQADAYFAGCDEGHRLARGYLEEEERQFAEAERQIQTGGY